MEFKEEEVVTKKSTIDVQSGEVHKVIENPSNGTEEGLYTESSGYIEENQKFWVN